MFATARAIVGVALSLSCAACGAERVWAPDTAVARARWVSGDAPTLTLITVTSTRNGSGAHSALLIDGRERVMFDPAGSYNLARTPERNDVHYGMDDHALAVYLDYHARVTYSVRLQQVAVSQDQADAAIRAAEAHGAAPRATCNLAVTRVLRAVPGFEETPMSWFPNRTSTWFASRPDVSSRTIVDDDSDDNQSVLDARGN
ncbi:MAG: hypothetical protein AAF566_12680 [Pseudomonadota bacterium]